jgi:hypothetical protein
VRQKPSSVRRRPPAVARGRAQALLLLALVWCLLLRRDDVHQRAAPQEKACVERVGERWLSRGACTIALKLIAKPWMPALGRPTEMGGETSNMVPFYL